MPPSIRPSSALTGTSGSTSPRPGRRDGENYNIGWIDVTDRPYPELVAAAKATHAKLDDIHSGKLAATTRKPKASEFGTPEDSIYLGIPAIQ